MKLNNGKVIIQILFLILSQSVYAQNNDLFKYEIEPVTSSQAIASVEVTKLFQDQKGYIWLGTATGISRYDGFDFENFAYADKQLIANIAGIVEDEDGVLWAAGINGLFYFNGQFFLPTEINRNPINCLFLDTEDNLIIGGSDFIPFVISSNDRKKMISKDTYTARSLIDSSFWNKNFKDRRVWEITEDDEGNIWLGLDRLLGRVHNDTLISVWSAIEPNIRVTDINAINPDSVYWGGEPIGLRRKQGDSIELIMDVYTYISSRTDSSLIFLTTKDLIKIDKNGRDTLSDLKSVDHLYFREMLQDREGNIWIAADGKLFKVSPNYFKSWTVKDNALLNSNHSITQLKSGKIIIGSSKQKIIEVNDSSFKIHREIPAAYNSVTEGILEDRSGNLWFATSMSGLILKSDKGLKQIGVNLGIIDKSLLFVKQDKYGRIWCGGENGISHVQFSNGELDIKSFYANTSPSSNYIFSNVICTTEGSCWAISNRDIYKIKQNTLERISIFENQEKPIISAAIDDREGGLIISTLGQGIYQLKPDNEDGFKVVKHWDKEDGLFSNVVINLHLDKLNRIWAFSQNGICSIEKREKKDILRYYDKNDGWVPLSTTHIDLHETNDGMMWVVANSTITTFPIYKMPINKVSPQVFIKEVLLFEGRENIEPYRNSNSTRNSKTYYLELPHNKNFLKFNFISTSFTHNEKNKFSFKLEGLDDSWSKPTYFSTASYPGLKPGNYDFKVIAINSSGKEGDKIASYPFQVLRPWYMTWWAILLYFLLISSILYTFYRLQLNKKKKENEASKLKELNEFQNHFYTNITHEFRTPLTVILGLTEKLSDQAEISRIAGAKRDLEMIHRNGKGLLKLINELLDISKLENGDMTLQVIQSDVSTFIKYNLESLKSLAAIKQVDLVCYSEEQVILMDYDEEKLSAIITNLVANAIKYSKKDDQIIIHLKREYVNGSPFLIIKIKDEGVGIAAAELPYIFERYNSNNSNQGLEGGSTGVGLALCKELINLMSGKVAVKSQVDIGTEFIVTIPIKNKARIVNISKPPIEPKKVFSSKENGSAIKQNKKHSELVLIVEDNIDVATYLMSCLENKYETFHAVDGQEGIEMALEHQPDLIICDVMMPRKNGYEVCELLKNDSRADHIPIILLTARVDEKDKLAGYSHGADAYLTKPFSRPELFTRIDQLILSRKKILDKISKNGVEAFIRNKIVDPEALFVQKAIKHIQDNMDNTDFGPALLAQNLLISESQVYRKLKAITGKSTALFIRSIRLQKAKDLLQKSEMNISEVAYEVGFTNPSWFSRAFKEEFGFSPSVMKN